MSLLFTLWVDARVWWLLDCRLPHDPPYRKVHPNPTLTQKRGEWTAVSARNWPRSPASVAPTVPTVVCRSTGTAVSSSLRVRMNIGSEHVVWASRDEHHGRRLAEDGRLQHNYACTCTAEIFNLGPRWSTPTAWAVATQRRGDSIDLMFGGVAEPQEQLTRCSRKQLDATEWDRKSRHHHRHHRLDLHCYLGRSSCSLDKSKVPPPLHHPPQVAPRGKNNALEETRSCTTCAQAKREAKEAIESSRSKIRKLRDSSQEFFLGFSSEGFTLNLSRTTHTTGAEK